MKKLLVGLMLCAGCATQGRLGIVDIDFRKPAQIEAGAREAEAPYRDCDKDACVEPEVAAQGLPLEWYTALFDMVTKLECRITLFKLEWKDGQ